MPAFTKSFLRKASRDFCLVILGWTILHPVTAHAQAVVTPEEKRAMLKEALRLVRRLERKPAAIFPKPTRQTGKWDVVLEIPTEKLTDSLSQDRGGTIGMAVSGVGSNSFLHIMQQEGGEELQNIGWHGFHLGASRSREGFDVVQACQTRAEYALKNENSVLAVYGFNLKRRQVILPKRAAYRQMVRSLHRKKIGEYRKWKRQLREARRRGDRQGVASLRANRPSVKIKKRELVVLLNKAINEDILRKRVYLNTRFNEPLCALLDRDTYIPITDEEVEAFFHQLAAAQREEDRVVAAEDVELQEN